MNWPDREKNFGSSQSAARKKMPPKASEAGADGVVLVKRSSGGLDNTTPPFGHPSSTEEGSSRFDPGFPSTTTYESPLEMARDFQ